MIESYAMTETTSTLIACNPLPPGQRKARSVGIPLTLDVAIMDFNEDCRGITFLSAVHGCCEQLPTLVVVDKDSEHAGALAYANGARFWLSKPVSPVELANAIADLQPPARQLAVA